MNLVDPRVAPEPWYTPWAAAWLNDRRDAVFVGLIVQCLVFAGCGVGLFFVGPALRWLAPIYLVALLALLLDRYTLMLHCTSHRQLFQPKYRALNQLIPWVIAPFFGQTPNTYFAHHMGMHHREENLAGDLSSTMRFQRDSATGWLRYVGRFLSVGLLDLTLYMKRGHRERLMRRIIVGELGYWTVFACLFAVRPAAALVVLAAPLLLIRCLMMAGNWAQHAFIASDKPDNPYNSSITCINSRYNRRCFNDGYHIGHHLDARAHWTELPVEFETNLARYGEQDAIVFDGLDFFMVWLLLMTGSWKRLARAFVQLPGAPVRNTQQVIALLKERVRPIPSPQVADVRASDQRAALGSLT
jgi:fatty acid desaturase